MEVINLRRWIGVLSLVFFLFGAAAPAYLMPSVTVAAASSTTKSDDDADGSKQNSGQQPEQDDSEEDSGDSDSGWMPEWVNDLIKKMNGIITMFQDMLSGKLIRDIIHAIIVAEVDEWITPVYGTFAKSYLFTPQVAEIDVVYTVWSALTIIGFALLFISSIWLAIIVIQGKKALKNTLIAFVVSIFAMMLSLIILNIINVTVNLMAERMMGGILSVKNISYAGLDGQQILKALLVGADGITDPTYAGQTLGTLVSQMPGGMWTLGLFLTGVVEPLYIFSIIKNVVLVTLVMGVPIWIAYTAFTGKLETLVGFLNLYIRTLIVGWAMGLHWALSVREQTEFPKEKGLAAALGIEPVYLTIFTCIVLIVILFIFWLIPLWRAIRTPLTLNGGGVIEKAGTTGGKISMMANMIGKRFGSETLQKKSLDWAEMSKRVQQFGSNMKNSRAATFSKIASSMTGGVSEAVQGVTYTQPTKWHEDGGSIVKDMDGEKLPMVRVNFPRGSNFLKDFIETLEKSSASNPGIANMANKLEVSTDKKNPHVYVPNEDHAMLLKLYDSYRKENIPYWTTRSGKVKVIMDGVPVDYGGIPDKGMDMGSFEQYQSEMLKNHAAAKSQTKKGG